MSSAQMRGNIHPVEKENDDEFTVSETFCSE